MCMWIERALFWWWYHCDPQLLPNSSFVYELKTSPVRQVKVTSSTRDPRLFFSFFLNKQDFSVCPFLSHQREKKVKNRI